ncbi:eukaryotic translation initiation factor 3 subunit E-B-like [Oscarella lobularis]|uniref:eukaryotic translation initiation factor 3 subunit E-B-like n=1 Tax=Oscarella lobularis TaxID=121494 RepID=UPI0033131F65
MADFDLTSVVGQHLDRHLVLPLLEFQSEKELYDEKSILEGKLNLLKQTNMVDLALDTHHVLHGSGDGEEDLIDRRKHVVEQLKALQNQTEPIVKIFESEDFQQHVQTTRDGRLLFEYLEREHGFQADMLNTLYDYAKFLYECGNYSDASEYLYFYKVLTPTSDKNVMNTLWGKLACEILMQNWDTAYEEMQKLKDVIDNQMSSDRPLILLQQRTWLLHWGLFVFFNLSPTTKGREALIQLCLYQPSYLNAIQTTCPHILRYLSTAVVVSSSSKRRNFIKELVKVIEQEQYAYRDPITEFIECLYVNFDFDGAEKKLKECETVLLNDFFLVACHDDFIENARVMIFETFCRIHRCMSISMLAQKLNMTTEEAERWIVNMIRSTSLDAKIDLKMGHVVMNAHVQSVHQQVIEKTKGLAFRSQVLSNNIEKRASARKSGPEWAWGRPDHF